MKNLAKVLGRNYNLVSSAEKGDMSIGIIQYYKGIKNVLNDYHSLKTSKNAVIVIKDNHIELYLMKGGKSKK